MTTSFPDILATTPIRQRKLEASPWPTQNQALTIFEESGAGEIRNLWFALGHQTVMFDSRLRVYVDGETTPSIDSDLGSIFLFHHSITANLSGNVAGAASHSHMHSQCYVSGSGVRSMVQFKFPIPFGNGIRIEIYNPTSAAITTQAIYALTAWTPFDAAPQYRLRSSSRIYAGTPAIATTATVDMMNVTGKAGVLAAVHYTGKGAGNYSWLERNMDIFVDGDTQPTLQNSGSEDFFFGGWYYTGRRSYSSPSAMVMQANTAGFEATQGVDLLDAYGGVRFENSLRLTLGTEAPGNSGNGIGVNVAHNASWAVLWYEDTV